MLAVFLDKMKSQESLAAQELLPETSVKRRSTFSQTARRKEQGKHRHDALSGVARSSLKPHVLNKLATSDLGGQLLMMPGQHNNSTQRSLQR